MYRSAVRQAGSIQWLDSCPISSVVPLLTQIMTSFWFRHLFGYRQVDTTAPTFCRVWRCTTRTRTSGPRWPPWAAAVAATAWRWAASRTSTDPGRFPRISRHPTDCLLLLSSCYVRGGVTAMSDGNRLSVWKGSGRFHVTKPCRVHATRWWNRPKIPQKWRPQRVTNWGLSFIRISINMFTYVCLLVNSKYYAHSTKRSFRLMLIVRESMNPIQNPSDREWLTLLNVWLDSCDQFCYRLSGVWLFGCRVGLRYFISSSFLRVVPFLSASMYTKVSMVLVSFRCPFGMTYRLMVRSFLLEWQTVA